MYKFFLIAIVLFIGVRTNAQNYDYQVTTDSSNIYEPLQNNQILEVSNNEVILPITFSFQFGDSSFSSVRINTQGQLVFDQNGDYGFFCFYGTMSKENSQLSYNISGQEGSKILKIQFKDFGYQSATVEDTLDFQIWLIENTASIEIHVGENSYSHIKNIDSPFKTMIGLADMNQGLEQNAYVLSGNPSSVVGNRVTVENTLPYLEWFPGNGMKYSFTPFN